MKSHSVITTTLLALGGAGLWSFAGIRLAQSGSFEFTPNPLGINRSPYGQVIAMAIQAPIDADWHGGIELHDFPSPGLTKASQQDHTGHEHVAEEADHHCSDPSCAHDHPENAERLSLLARLDRATKKRTNPTPPSPAHKFYLRREIEKKLRFAYDLDPSHYGNYTAYHLFLTNRDLGTSSDDFRLSAAHATDLADHTIRYCLAEQNDPRPLLTAAAAAYNALEVLISMPGGRTTNDLRNRLTILDFCLRRHFELLDSAASNGTWALLSPERQKETLDRGHLALKLRDAAEKAILRIEKEEQPTALHEPS